MKIVSFLPAATEIVCALGLYDELYGVSHECNFPANVTKKPRVSVVDRDYNAMSSKEIDRHVEKSMHERKSLYTLDKNLLDTIQPTHILTQALCDVCAITPSDIQKVIKDLVSQPSVIELNPRSLEEICQDVLSLGKEFHRGKDAKKIVAALKRKIKTIRKQTQKLPKKTVFCMEWLDPVYACGHWVPEMVEIAGGIDPLSFPNAYSKKISWEAVVNEDPEIIIIMACSFSIQKTIEELPIVTKRPFWKDLQAVKEHAIWVVDGASYFNQSGIRTIDTGIEILAKIIHPETFGKPSKKEAVRIAAI